jgi:hypothetical protein
MFSQLFSVFLPNLLQAFFNWLLSLFGIGA